MLRAGLLEAQPFLRREDDERRVPFGVHLPAQQVEELRRRRGVAHLHVVLGGGREEALDARRRVLRPLAVVAVRQQQDEPVALAPLVLGGDDVLVDDDLGAVDEVAELRLPHHERLGRRLGVAVLEAERRRTPTAASRTPRTAPTRRPQVVERDPRLAGLVVDQRGVAMRERAPPGVLTGEPDAVALEHERPDTPAPRPVAQSTSPSANSLARASNCLASLGCGVNVSGYAVSEAKIALERRPLDAGRDRRQHAERLRRARRLVRRRRLRPRLVEGDLQLRPGSRRAPARPRRR